MSAIPLWLLARDRLGDPWLALGVPLAWLLYPAVEWMTKWPFQPEYLGVPALLFAYWLADRGRWRWYAVCVVLVLATKEDAGSRSSPSGSCSPFVITGGQGSSPRPVPWRGSSCASR